MKKEFFICASCRIIGIEAGDLLFVIEDRRICGSCGIADATFKLVEAKVEVRDRGKNIDVYVVRDAIDPSTETLREELIPVLDEVAHGT